MGNNENPNDVANGSKGNNKAINAITSVLPNKYFPGLLLITDLCVRTTNTMSEAEMTDSINQPV